jgi:hypothetical protein
MFSYKHHSCLKGRKSYVTLHTLTKFMVGSVDPDFKRFCKAAGTNLSSSSDWQWLMVLWHKWPNVIIRLANVKGFKP